MGRKAKYTPDFPLLAEDFARRGMIDKEIAKSLGISPPVYYEYQKIYPEFLAAIKRGKAPVDVEVENCLLKRARGFEYEEVLVEYKPDGKDKEEGQKPVLIRKTQKMAIPDTVACIFWVKNRRPDLWKDKQNIAISGGLNLKVLTAVPRAKGKKKNAKR